MSSFTLAEISISPPSSVYNLGDRLYISIDGIRGTDTGNLNVNLVCGNNTTNMVRISARSFSADEDQSYRFYKILNQKDFGITNSSQILGECRVTVTIGSDIISTKPFLISNKVDVSASLDKKDYDPGEPITVSIIATKENKDLLNGFIDGSNATNFKKAVSGGIINYTFSMPDTTEPGTYHLNIYAYDIWQNGILNKGHTEVSFRIRQIVSSVVISLSSTNVTPSQNLTIGANVFDQSGKSMDGVVSIQIVSPKNKVTKYTIANKKFKTIPFALNSTAGTWKIISSLDGVTGNKEFSMARLQKVNFSIDGSLLSITNIGNTLYNKTISVKVGNKSRELKLNIAIGETRKFNLKAPNGKYDVAISDGKSSINKKVLLTGNAVSINDIKSDNIFWNFSIIWIFIILILAGICAILFIRYKKTRTLKSGDIPGGNKISKNNPTSGKFIQNIATKNRNKKTLDLTKQTSDKAEHTLVLNGEKYMSAIVALNIKNYNELNEMARETLHQIIKKSQKNKGLVDFRNEHIFIVFSPLITKTYNNEILSAKTGMSIFKDLNEYNRKFRNKIKFNIGIHSGELIASLKGGKLKYTSIGNTISLPKKISDSDDGKLIASETIRNKILRELKVVAAKEVGGSKTYEVSEIKDKSADAARLKDLLKRIE